MRSIRHEPYYFQLQLFRTISNAEKPQNITKLAIIVEKAPIDSENVYWFYYWFW